MDEWAAVELIGFLTRSKAIWRDPELLNLVESAPSPSQAFTIVLRHTGSQRKAKAARWYACAIRDYGKDSLGALVAVLRSPQGAAKLEKLLTHAPENGAGRKEHPMYTAEQLFVKHGEGDEVSYPLNPDLVLRFQNQQEAARYLVEAIRFWRLTRKLFCHDNTWKELEVDGKYERVDLPEAEWTFEFKAPSDCSGCVSAQQILGNIFGNLSTFLSFPFVESLGRREYRFRFSLLCYFAEHGLESTVRLIDAEKQEAARKEAEALNERRATKLLERLGNQMISEELWAKLLEYTYEPLVVLGWNIAVVVTERSQHGGGGGVAMWSGVRVFYGDQVKHVEWQWRDRFNPDRDRPDLYVHYLGKIEVEERDDTTIITVEIVNVRYGNREHAFTFERSKAESVQKLSAEDAAKFVVKAHGERDQLMAELERLWNLKPYMQTNIGRVPYHNPTVKQEVVKADMGVAAWVLEEQIDHRGDVRQMRYSLYVLKPGQEAAKFLTEDHGYESGEGAFLAITDVRPCEIEVNTKEGKKTISIS